MTFAYALFPRTFCKNELSNKNIFDYVCFFEFCFYICISLKYHSGFILLTNKLSEYERLELFKKIA